MDTPISREAIVFEDGIPPKNKLLMAVLFLKAPLFLPFMKSYVKRHLPHCSRIDFVPGFMFYYGNIHARNVGFTDTFILDYAPVYVGENSAFGWNNIIITAMHDAYSDFSRVVAKPVIIGKNVYITSRCVITGGVSIGDNSIIAAGSVVVNDIPPNSFAGGNPAKVIKRIEAPLHGPVFPQSLE